LRIVSLEGELINVSGAMTGGNGNPSGHSLLQRRGEEKRLLQVQEENRLAREENRKLAKDLSSKLQELEPRINTQHESLRESQFGYEMLVKQLGELNRDLQVWDEEREKYLKQLEDLDNEAMELGNTILELQNRQEQMHNEGEEAATELEEWKENFELVKRDYEVRRERLVSYTDQLDMKKRELENINKNIIQLEQVKDSYRQSRQQSGDLRKRLEEEIGTELLRIESLNSEVYELETNVGNLQEEMGQVQKTAEVLRASIGKIRSEIIPARQEMAQAENQIRNMEVNIARLEAEMDAIAARWLEKFGEEMTQDIQQLFAAGEIREDRKRIELLRRQVEEIGPVDLESISECDEITGRLDFMQQQYEDLVNARDSLQLLQKETEKIMLKNFSAFLMLANESFRKTFNEIFSGGEAFLKLETEVDRLEAGVNIEVKMPGKKHQSLNLLSGGERALTCIAFIFSLLRLRPAPFCLMDEIDASLDEVNLNKFSQFIKVMAQKIQFIIITHRQATIEAGENIYGITMPEEGISSVFSINVVEAESLAG
ncbi:MAG: AAA family ATPase, partial [Syntrophomonas sp.]